MDQVDHPNEEHGRRYRFNVDAVRRLPGAVEKMFHEEICDRDESFSSVEHLSAEAVACYVDGELSPKALNRARRHLLHCSICRRDVREQLEASQTLKGLTGANEGVHVPRSLVSKLANLSSESCTEGPKAGDILHPESLRGRLEPIYWTIRRTHTDRTD